MTSDEVAALLPEVVLRMIPTSPVLDGLLAAMAALQSPSEEAHARMEDWLEPSSAPLEALSVVCAWFGLDPNLAVDERALRRLVSEAPWLQATRGRAACLVRMLEICTGASGFTVEPSQARPFHVEIGAPASLRSSRSRIEAIVLAGKPAHVSHDLLWREPVT